MKGVNTKAVFRIVQKKNLWFLLSLGLIISGLSMMSYKALNNKPFLNFGIDFTGGSSFILKFDQLPQKTLDSNESQVAFIQKFRSLLRNFGLEKSRIQISNDKELIIRTQELNNALRVSLLREIEEKIAPFEVLEIDVVGPTIGAELREQSFWIILFVSFALLGYISWRFELSFGLAALVALLHDALIVITGATLFNIEVNTAFVAAILTVLGYSINDTIVIFDRVREMLRKKDIDLPLEGLINMALTQTMRRTLHTSTTTFFVVGTLLLLGGSTLKSFAAVLLIGVLSGTYSSIFIGSPLLWILERRKELRDDNI